MVFFDLNDNNSNNNSTSSTSSKVYTALVRTADNKHELKVYTGEYTSRKSLKRALRSSGLHVCNVWNKAVDQKTADKWLAENRASK